MLLSLCSQSQNEHVPCTKKSQDCHNLCQLLRLWHLCQHRQLCPLSSVPTVPSALFVPILPFLHLYLLQKRVQQCQLCHWCQICQMFYLSTLGQINVVLCSLVLAGRFYFTIFEMHLDWINSKSPLQLLYIYLAINRTLFVIQCLVKIILTLLSFTWWFEFCPNGETFFSCRGCSCREMNRKR